MTYDNQTGAHVQQQQELQRQRDDQQRAFTQNLENQNRVYQQQRENSQRQQQEYTQQQAANAASSRRMQDEWDRQRATTYTSSPSSYRASGGCSNYSSRDDSVLLEFIGSVVWIVGIPCFVAFLILYPVVFELISDFLWK